MLGAPFSRSSLAFVLGDWYNAVVSIYLKSQSRENERISCENLEKYRGLLS